MQRQSTALVKKLGCIVDGPDFRLVSQMQNCSVTERNSEGEGEEFKTAMQKLLIDLIRYLCEVTTFQSRIRLMLL